MLLSILFPLHSIAKKSADSLWLQAQLDSGLIHLKSRKHPEARYYFLAVLDQDSASCMAAHAWNNLGIIFKREGQSYTALSYYDRALDLYDAHRCMIEAVRTRLNAAQLASKLGEYDRQINYLLVAVAQADTLQNSYLQCYGLLYLGRAHKQKKQWDQADRYYQQALTLAKDLNGQEELASIYNSLGNLYREQDSLSEALAVYRASLAIKQSLSDSRAIATAYHNLGATYTQLHVLDSAVWYYDQALGIKYHLDSAGSEGLAMTLNELGHALLLQGHTAEARPYLQHAFAIGVQLQLPATLMRSSELLRQFFTATNQLDSANWYADRYLAYYQQNYQQSQAEELLRLQQKYESEKKDGLISSLQELEQQLQQEARIKDLTLAQQRSELKTKNLFLILLGIMAVVLVLGFWVYRQKAQIKQLQFYSQGQEFVKEKVALELHDKVANAISGVRMSMVAIASSPKEQVLVDQLGELYEQVRGLSHDLAPVRYRFEDQTLLEALSNLFADFQRLYGISVYYENHTGNVLNRLPTAIAVEVYLIVNELLQNVHKHARSKKVTIHITQHRQVVHVKLNDFGIGLPKHYKSGVGVHNIRSRAKIISATFDLQTWENGTTATLNIPLYKHIHD